MFVQDNDGKCNWSAPTTSLAPLIWSCISGGWFWLSLCNISFDSLGVICHSPHSILCSIHYILWGFAVDDQQEYNWHCWIGYCASPEWEDIAVRAWKPGAMPPGQVNHIPPFFGHTFNFECRWDSTSWMKVWALNDIGGWGGRFLIEFTRFTSNSGICVDRCEIHRSFCRLFAYLHLPCYVPHVSQWGWFVLVRKQPSPHLTWVTQN